MTAKQKPAPRWLVFFYSVPATPVRNRMAVWRRLTKIGAVQLKGAVYVLPSGGDRLEALQWLVSEVASMGGEAAFLGTDRIEPMPGKAVIALFDGARAKDYQAIERDLSEIERKIDAVKKGGARQGLKPLAARLSRLAETFEDTLKIDFFGCPEGRLIKDRLTAAKARLSAIGPDLAEVRTAPIGRLRIGDYQGRVWATRKRPFIDRMASAWLIRRFIDPEATFEFVDEDAGPGKGAILFDTQGGEFTHIGDLCTFEVVLKRFEIKDKAAMKIAEIVHELDVKDGKYPEARGVEDILAGIRKSISDDNELLSKGIEIFEMLYTSKK